MKKQNQKFIFLLLFTVILLLWAGAAFYTFRSFAGRVANDYFAPYLKFGSMVSDGANDISLKSLTKNELIQLVKGLQAENQVLTAQSMLMTELERQNKELRKMINLPYFPGWKSLPAEIILRDPSQWLYSFTISKGSSNGVNVGCAVFTIGSNGTSHLLGRVSAVSEHSAKVMSIHNKELHLSGRLNISRATGLINSTVNSGSEYYLRISYLPRDLQYVNEEEVFTGGFENNVPPGLKIGNLVSVDKNSSIYSNELYLNGWIKPSADLNDLRFVYVAVPDGSL